MHDSGIPWFLFFAYLMRIALPYIMAFFLLVMVALLVWYMHFR